MTDAHTPSPWHMNDDIIHANGAVVGAVNRASYMSSDRIAANGRLLAAAPDLLDALEKAQHILWKAAAKHPTPRNYKAWQAAQDAISKAKGNA